MRGPASLLGATQGVGWLGVTTLYRAYNKFDVLLYVGITDSLDDRLAQHRMEKGWWPEVTQVTTHEFGSRLAALNAEAKAIFWEEPRYNVLGSPRYDADWEAKYHALEDERARWEKRLSDHIHELIQEIVRLDDEVDTFRVLAHELQERLAIAQDRPYSRSMPDSIKDILAGVGDDRAP